MRCYGLLIAAALMVPLWGCANSLRMMEPERPRTSQAFENPLWLPSGDPTCVWETVVDVVDDYFRIDREEPVRVVSGTATEGRLDTYPEIGSSIFEPWAGDSANGYERLESTLQSIRRWASIRVVPNRGGYSLDVAVYKELEDVAHAAHAPAPSAAFARGTSLTRIVQPVGVQEANRGWVSLGRDPALEQRILGQLRYRLGMPPAGAPPPASQPAYEPPRPMPATDCPLYNPADPATAAAGPVPSPPGP